MTETHSSWADALAWCCEIIGQSDFERKRATEMRWTRATALVVALLVATAGCSGDGKDQDKGADERSGTPSTTPSPSPRPKPVPAITVRGAEAVLRLYLPAVNKANTGLDRARASKVETGSALQIHTAQYRVYRKNNLRYPAVKYDGVLGASPMVTGYPRWFFTAAVDRGSEPATRDFLLFVQERSGTPWRVTYAPFSSTTTGGLAPGVDVADFPAVVPLGDAGLATSPGKLAATLADAATLGSKSPYVKKFMPNDLFKKVRARIDNDHKAYTSNGWAGTSRAVDAKTPAYAVRTKSGGALVWFGLDLHHSYRNKGKTNMTWETQNAGDMQKGFGLPSEVTTSITRHERYELVAYIPPRGKGVMHLIAGRWFPLAIRGS